MHPNRSKTTAVATALVILGQPLLASPSVTSQEGSRPGTGTPQPAATSTPPSEVHPAAGNSISYRHRVLLESTRSTMDVGHSFAGGPYAGLEGRWFALRWSPGWTLALPDLSTGILGASSGYPWVEPELDAERDDPKRGFLRWRVGQQGDSLHFEVGLIESTLGHGSAVRQYMNSPEGTPLAFGLSAEGQLNGGGLALVLGDVVKPQRFLAAHLRLKPLNIILSPDSALEPSGLNIDPRAEILGLVVVGFGAATDLDAPVTLDALGVDGGQIAGRGARAISTFTAELELASIDVGIFHLTPYVDGVMLMGRGDGPGYGLHPGLSVGSDFFGNLWELRFQYCAGTDGYKPWYFDSRYAYERVRTTLEGAPKGSVDSPAPASHAYLGSAGVQLAGVVTAWAEMGDQIPMDPSAGPSYGRLRLGATAGPPMANLSATVLREGWTSYDRLFAEDGVSACILQGKLSLAVVTFVARYTYSVEYDPRSKQRFQIDSFNVGTEFGLAF